MTTAQKWLEEFVNTLDDTLQQEWSTGAQPNRFGHEAGGHDLLATLRRKARDFRSTAEPSPNVDPRKGDRYRYRPAEPPASWANGGAPLNATLFRSLINALSELARTDPRGYDAHKGAIFAEEKYEPILGHPTTALIQSQNGQTIQGWNDEATKEIFTRSIVGVSSTPPPSGREGTEPDWMGLAEQLKTTLDERRLVWCELIFVYWLDELGTHLSLERLADRLENGALPHTQALQDIHIPEWSELALYLNRFATLWWRGDLAAVDDRRRQYLALYGFPLLAAARHGSLDTADPRTNFPSAFHRMLSEAMKYYRERRNLEMVADVRPAHAALVSLSRILREGDENLRLRRPPDLRAQLEYIKGLLGGVDPFRTEWRGIIGGRPGVADGRADVDWWLNTVDSVQTRYAWRRPLADDYLQLAKHGEVILLMVRAFGNGIESWPDNVARAFFDVMNSRITSYVSAYHTVARVDLERRPFLGSPAEAMKRHVTPPPVPSLRRNWTGLPTRAA